MTANSIDILCWWSRNIAACLFCAVSNYCRLACGAQSDCSWFRCQEPDAGVWGISKWTRTCRQTAARIGEMKCLSRSEEYPTVLTVLSRVLAAKHYSADVERCVSANNLIKTSLRSRLNLSTETRYLFIYHNLPPSAAWNPRPAVLSGLMQKSRRTKDPKKGKAQLRHFRNVFPGGSWQWQQAQK